MLPKWLNKEKELLSGDKYGPIVFQSLKQQVFKDFDLRMDEDTIASYEDLKALIVRELSPLWKGQSERLKHTLYRIDLSESDIREELNHKSIAEQIESLAQLIADRELKKVVMRLYFSGKL